ncbi:GPO family capsid scaffolding protein [Marinobacterium stanieri]|uniref:Phage capsid scaffolding protein (GPO) serine peptidase n=1 Tax=Marinobacterium stanieri TaxID=49186 RepID=A0A1N6Q2C0_9GAMM|nr:GPO family capsid scaffolding protein [Marinobacterium stanieri]SIQ10599.1 Phage capsid scaffolding protein (GPO) serine peptidase [Marinobacterium stanieri]
MAKKALKSKWFRVGVAGDTTDGREIDPKWLEEMAETYNPETYGARVNCEHVRGMAPDGSFGAFGDVLALKTETVQIDGEDKVALYAQISPNDDLVALNKKRKKVYTSMEIDHNFSGKDKAYLVGLAVTDSPASLGTEMLEFAAKAQHNPFNDRKQKPENVFSAAREVELEFEDSTSILDKVKSIFSKSEATHAEQHGDVTAAIEAIASEVADLKDQFSELGKGNDDTEQLKKLQTDLSGALEKLNTLEQQLDKTPNFTRRPAASGGNGQLVTDC